MNKNEKKLKGRESKGKGKVKRINKEGMFGRRRREDCVFRVCRDNGIL